MKFSTVQIKTSNVTADWMGCSKEKPVWGVTFYDDPQERKNVVTKPNPLGFYHYPTEHVTRAMAFTALKEAIIQKHKSEIAMLQDSMQKLEALTI